MKTVLNILKFIGMVILVLAINITPMLLIGKQNDTPIFLQWISSILYLIAAPAIIWFFWNRYKKNKVIEPEKKAFTWTDFGYALVFFLVGRVIAVVGTLILQAVTGNATSANDAALMSTEEQLKNMFPFYCIIFHAAIGLFAPLMEELTFRGFFGQHFFSKKNIWAKALVSSFIFALLHVTVPIELILYLPLGLLFYAAYHRRGNIKDAIAVHILNNSLLVIFSIIGYLVILFG